VPVFSREYPQLLEYAKQAEALFEQFDVNKDSKLSKEEFQQVLKSVDSTVTSLPSTANMAVQQGKKMVGVS
jgi:Ca2+-binding EF-hand superfamily protein